MSHQLDELVKGNVFNGTEVWVLLNSLLPQHTHHFLTAYTHTQGKANILFVLTCMVGKAHIYKQTVTSPYVDVS